MMLSTTCVGSGDCSQDRQDVLLPSETEAYIEAMQPSTFDELGSLGWIEKHHRVEKLTIQAIVEALSKREELVQETLVAHEKLTVLVHDIILVELWREKILPALLDLIKDSRASNSFTIYTILLHEAMCVNLIETVLFHPETAEILEHDVLDLIDYCFRSINKLLAMDTTDESSNPPDSDSDFKRQTSSLWFRIGFKCLTILRYIIENIEKINSAVVPRLIVSADAPMLLSDLLVKKPWRRVNSKGQEQEYSDEMSSWVDVKPHGRFVLGKIEIQVWLAIYQIFLSPRVISTYEIHHYRRSQLLRLTGLLNEVVLDQLPILGEFQRWLHELSMGAHFGPTKSPLVIEMLPQYRTQLENELDQRRSEILRIHEEDIVVSTPEKLTEKARKLSSMYDMATFESALPASKCAKCGQPALKKCSRCHLEYYCKRECQVADWKKHKPACDKLSAQQ